MKLSKIFKCLNIISLPTVITACSLTSCSNSKLSVVLYAQYGTFSNQSDNLVLNCDSGTKLKDIAKYEIPKSSSNLTFTKWVNSKGDVISEDTVINENQVVIAVFEDVATTPSNFSTDTWATIVKASKSAVDFYNAYVKTSNDRLLLSTEESEAITEIQKWINTDKNIRTLPIYYGDYVLNVKIRMIGVNEEKPVDTSVTKTIFTYECAEVFGSKIFDSTSSDWFFNDTGCSLRTYLQTVLINQLPQSIQSNIIKVKKSTILYRLGREIVQDSEEDLFLLSLHERHEGEGSQEGVPYTYYKDTATGGEREPKRIKCYVGTENSTRYWVRSAQDIEKTSSTISDFNGFHDIEFCYRSSALAPAFCI